jgi:type I restriction enzyme, R subunit
MMQTPEQRAREKIDALLAAAGWIIQDNANFNRNAGEGVAVREFSLPNGPCDYLLFVGGKAVGIVEAKKAGMTLSGVSEQAEKYMAKLPDHLARWADQLVFDYESTGEETYFRDTRDPDPRSRRVFAFHQPQTLHAWLKESDTLRRRLQRMPPLDEAGLRDCQIEAIHGLDASLAKDHPRALIQMATGAGKTYTACVFSHRLLEHAKFRVFCFSPTAPIWSARRGTSSRIFARPARAGLLPSSTMSSGSGLPVSTRTPRSPSPRSSASIRC